MEIPEKNTIDERFLERLRMKRLKQATESEIFNLEKENETIVETSYQLDPVYFVKDSESNAISTFNDQDYYQNEINKESIHSNYENQEYAEESSIEEAGFLQDAEKEIGLPLEENLNKRDEFLTFVHHDFQFTENILENDFNQKDEKDIPFQSDTVENMQVETGLANDNRHPNEIYRATVQQILEGKKKEFIILGYETINEDLLWQYLIEKTWKRAKETYRLHQVVADIYTIRPNDFMNHATVEVFKKSEPKSRQFSLNMESLKGLF